MVLGNRHPYPLRKSAIEIVSRYNFAIAKAPQIINVVGMRNGSPRVCEQTRRLSFTAKAARCDDVHDMIPEANQNTQ